ncbi:MAG: hypothetical protein CMN30_31795 [Sandaracinus sp.]|nr:hypothetical protein [Sandaracinus sp.]
MPDVDVDTEEEELVEEDEDLDVDAAPADDMDLLSEAEPPPSSDPTLANWTAPRSVVTLNGYFRARGELYDNFFLGRGQDYNGNYDATDAPFARFVPAGRIAHTDGVGLGCDRGDEAGASSPCDSSDQLRFANMRLRLRPTIALSDDVKVHMMVDALDNVILGSTPDVGTYSGPTGYTRTPGAPGVPVDSFATTLNPPLSDRNYTRDSIYVRRAWAEVTNRGIGQLRFGRMGNHWGLGMLWNGGDGIDSDYSSDVDRVMLMTKFAGFHFFGAYDFAAQGIQSATDDLRSLPMDGTAKDDLRQFVVGAARREDEDEANARLQRGGWVLEGGLYFAYRTQSWSSAGVTEAFPSTGDYFLVERDANLFMPDLWGRFRWGGLRLEVEMAGIFGSIGNVQNGTYEDDPYDVRQFGFAFEGEYRLLDDKLAIRLYTGFATGDQDVNGLSSQEDMLTQRTADRTLSTFQFHPNYRVDLILWRNIMQRVAGAWYLKPGLGYDIIKNPFGQIFGVRADMIYSRAAQETQAYGADPNLGLELNFSLYYQSEDGPDLMDGFYASFQYGVLFPLAGLEFPAGDTRARDGTAIDIGNAQSMRLILGVQF